MATDQNDRGGGRAVCVYLSIERIMRGTCGYDYEPAGLHKYEKGRGEKFMKHLELLNRKSDVETEL